MELLKKLQNIHAPAGAERPIADFLLNYIKDNKDDWKVRPKIYQGPGFQDTIILVFGIPNVAVFAHQDSIGFTVRYGNQLVKIGGPRAETGYTLVGNDSIGPIECKLIVNEDKSMYYEFDREIDRGTTLTFKPNWREDEEYVQNCYMDDRLGLYVSLKLCETIENGAIVFSCWEETGGGSAEVAGKWLYENFAITKALISDITWVTDGVHPGKGVVISMRDTGLPRKEFVNRIIELANNSGIDYQLEVESAGGSDGNALQRSSFPWDWCFIGAPEDHVHSPDERVHKHDIKTMIELYEFLVNNI